MSNNITNELVVTLPNSTEALLNLFKRIVGKGLAIEVSKQVNKSLDIHDTLIENKSMFKIEDLNDFRFIPIFLSIRNYCNNTIALQKMWNLNEITIWEAAKGLVQCDINSILNKDRNKILSIYNIGKIAILGFKEFNQLTEIYYGSSTATSTDTSAEDYVQLIPNSLDLMMEKFEEKLAGNYKEVVETSYADAYANFFK